MKKLLLSILLLITGLAAQEWPAPTNLQGSLSNLDDITLTWDRPAGVKYGILTGYNIYRNGMLKETTTAAQTTYDDTDLSSGTYLYTVKAEYTTPDGESLPSNTYEVAVVPDDNYPVPTSISCSVNGRHSIDISWVTPYCGSIYFFCDFETLDADSDWHHERTVDYPPTGRKIQQTLTIDNFNQDDITDGWFQCDAASFSGSGSDYIYKGDYSMAIDKSSSGHTWAFSPVFTIEHPDAELRFRHRITGNSSSGQYTTAYVNLYTGDFTETDPSENLTEIAAYININESTQNLFESDEAIELTAFTGNFRLAWVYKQNNGQNMAVDEIIIGSNGGYYGVNEIYRNGIYAATVENEIYWSDTGFDDGLNEYYIKAVYPTGTSIASDRTSAYIMANPSPGYLAGVLSANQRDVDLSWYAPLHLPPHWFGYIDDIFEEYFDNFFDMGLPGTWAERRTVFTASGLGPGNTYPFTVDSLAAAFYEGDYYWTGSNFTYEVWTTNTAGTADSTIYLTGNQTALSGYWSTHGLPAQRTMNWGWYVSLHVNNDGTPSSLVNVHGDGTPTHSQVYYGGDGTYSPGWYSITFGDDNTGDWAILCFGQGAVDEWYFNKAEAPVEKLTLTPNGVLKGTVKPDLNAAVENSKALIKYNVWRNGVDIADVSHGASPVSFTDINVPAAPFEGHEYWITAVYSNPEGESDPSESFILCVSVIDPCIVNLTTSYDGSNFCLSWDASPIATGYCIYSSSNPYGTFDLIDSTAETSWSVPASESKKFYYITATDEVKKKTPEKIFLQKDSR